MCWSLEEPAKNGYKTKLMNNFACVFQMHLIPFSSQSVNCPKRYLCSCTAIKKCYFIEEFFVSTLFSNLECIGLKKFDY